DWRDTSRRTPPRPCPLEQAWEVLIANHVELVRIALTEDDARDLGPELCFSAEEKRSDPRYTWFVRRFGQLCFEVGALNPTFLRGRVREAVLARLDTAAWSGGSSPPRTLNVSP